MRLCLTQTSCLRASRAGAYAWVLVLAFVWSQSLGLWHGIVHASHGAGAAPISAVVADTWESTSPFEALFGSHFDTVDCQLFDQLSHGDALATAPVLVLPLGVPAAHIAHLTGLAVARWAALFQARAPPVSR